MEIALRHVCSMICRVSFVLTSMIFFFCKSVLILSYAVLIEAGSALAVMLHRVLVF